MLVSRRHVNRKHTGIEASSVEQVISVSNTPQTQRGSFSVATHDCITR